MNNVLKSFLEEAITNRDLVEQLISQITFEENKLQETKYALRCFTLGSKIKKMIDVEKKFLESLDVNEITIDIQKEKNDDNYLLYDLVPTVFGETKSGKLVNLNNLEKRMITQFSNHFSSDDVEFIFLKDKGRLVLNINETVENIQDKLLKIMLPQELIKVVDFVNFSQDIEKGNSEKNTTKIKI